MSMFVKLRTKERMHNGYVHKIGSVLKLPNALALSLLSKGFAVEPTERETIACAESRSAKRKTEREAIKAAKAKGGKKDRG